MKKSTLREQLGYLDDPQLAAFLGIEVQTLKARRSKGDVPPSAKVGQARLTTVEDVRAYVARQKAARKVAA